MKFDIGMQVSPYGVSQAIIAVDIAYKKGYSISKFFNIPDDKRLELECLSLYPSQILFCDTYSEGKTIIYEENNYLLYIIISGESVSSITCYSDSELKIQQLELVWNEKLSIPTSSEHIVPVTFWYDTESGPKNYSSNITTPDWNEININYPLKVREKLQHLNCIDNTNLNGRIILLYGEPGTGKTYFIRSLLENWKKWCVYNYVIDVDKLFSKDAAHYLIEVLGVHKNIDKHRLLILEDCGELISKDAKQIMGQALSRILNITDGLMGSGLKLILLLSTNEEFNQVNDAISRPGRCLANIEFEKFSSLDAQKWLENHGSESKITSSQTLANLYEKLNNKLIKSSKNNKIGF